MKTELLDRKGVTKILNVRKAHEHMNAMLDEVERLSAILKSNGIDPQTGKASTEKVETPINVSLRDGKAVIKRIQ